MRCCCADSPTTPRGQRASLQRPQFMDEVLQTTENSCRGTVHCGLITNFNTARQQYGWVQSVGC